MEGRRCWPGCFFPERPIEDSAPGTNHHPYSIWQNSLLRTAPVPKAGQLVEESSRERPDFARRRLQDGRGPGAMGKRVACSR